ncbi:MAG: alpha/beta hydrolase [Aeoliella sp.]
MKLPLPRRRTLRRVAVCMGVLVALFAATAWYVAGELLAPCPSIVGPPPDDFAAEVVSFVSESGSRISGWLHHSESGRGVVVIAHGIRGSRRSSLSRAKLLGKYGYSTLLFDLQAHGESPGEQITLGHLERFDVQAAVSFARLECPGQPIAVIGFSLGGAAAVLGSPLDVNALVIETVYPTIEEAVDNRTRHRLGPIAPIASWALLLQLEPRTGINCRDLRPIDKMHALGCPVLVIGGGQDFHTTMDQTRQLYAAAAEPKQLGIFEDLGHRNYAREAPELYENMVVKFLQQHMD